MPGREGIIKFSGLGWRVSDWAVIDWAGKNEDIWLKFEIYTVNSWHDTNV